MEKIDRLFLSKDCIECANVRSMIDFDAVIDDGFRGKDGQKLHVFSALSNEATRELLDTFGNSDSYSPLLVTHDGKKLDKVNNIVNCLRENNALLDS
jgi:hypothetical protein